MASVSVELQTAIFEALVADGDLSSVVEGRVYDGVPADPEFPFISFGPSDGDALDLVGISARREAAMQQRSAMIQHLGVGRRNRG